MPLPLRALRGVCGHFFPRLNRQLAQLPDRRDPARATYDLPTLIWAELAMLISGVPSRYAMVDASHDDGFADSLVLLAGMSEKLAAPHPDTPYVFLQHLEPASLDAVIGSLTGRLLRMRCFDGMTFQHEWLVGVDATWVRTFNRRHCANCLRQKQADGSYRYFHAVLEAKLLLANGMVLPMASIPIQNDDPDASKQDCEQKAFPRLAELLRQRFPKLPICLAMDSLYGVGPVLDLCQRHRFSYIVVFKEGRAPAFYQEAVARAARVESEHVRLPRGVEQDFTWAHRLDWNGRTVHAIFCREKKPQPDQESHWGWLSDLRPDRRLAPIIANQGGRRRWNHEENYNELKNGPPQQHHDFGSQGHAWYNTWLLAQLALMLLQLIFHTDVFRAVTGHLVNCFGDLYRTMAGFVSALRIALWREAARASRPLPPMHLHFVDTG